jgi:hypothetical protein
MDDVTRGNFINVLEGILRLRQLVTHPLLLKNDKQGRSQYVVEDMLAKVPTSAVKLPEDVLRQLTSILRDADEWQCTQCECEISDDTAEEHAGMMSRCGHLCVFVYFLSCCHVSVC